MGQGRTEISVYKGELASNLLRLLLGCLIDLAGRFSFYPNLEVGRKKIGQGNQMVATSL